MEIQLEIRCELRAIQGIYMIQVAGSRSGGNTVWQIEHFDAKLAIFPVPMYGEHRAFSNAKITVSNVCYHHRHEI
jgi:hypothetical protein